MIELRKYEIRFGFMAEPLAKQLSDQGMIHLSKNKKREGEFIPTPKKDIESL